MSLRDKAQESSSHFNIAGFWSRFMAITIDLAVLVVFAFLLLVFSGSAFHGAIINSFNLEHILEIILKWFLLVVLGIGITTMSYFSILHALCGQTIGKKIMGIRLSSCAAGELGIGSCFLRWVGYFISALPLFFGFLWALLDVEGRTWHDKMAGTRVVEEEFIV